ncbi:hypothetical protein K438DRAFT_2008898 [Mycena galopus ATCC 62051]|nr:hypothetical protein K438DRAFT_2008898 [Mycena galopus ATCC 62051]
MASRPPPLDTCLIALLHAPFRLRPSTVPCFFLWFSAFAYGSAAHQRSVSARFGFSRRLRISGKPSGRDSPPPHTHTLFRALSAHIAVLSSIVYISFGAQRLLFSLLPSRPLLTTDYLALVTQAQDQKSISIDTTIAFWALPARHGAARSRTSTPLARWIWGRGKGDGAINYNLLLEGTADDGGGRARG